MTARETIEAKAARLLAGGRVTVTSVTGDHVSAACQGDTGAYDLGYDPRRPGGWWCSCRASANGRTCSHLLALQLVTVRRRPAAQATGPSLRRAG